LINFLSFRLLIKSDYHFLFLNNSILLMNMLGYPSKHAYSKKTLLEQMFFEDAIKYLLRLEV